VHDLTTIIESPLFANDPTATTRIAMVHRSFRSVGMRRGMTVAFFKAHFPALGLLNLAESLRQAVQAGEIPDLEIRYFDEDAFEHEVDLVNGVKEWLAPAERPIVAASSYTQTIDRLEQFFFEFDPTRYLIMVGGAHASTASDIAGCHIAVRGEGIAGLKHVLKTLGTEQFAVSAPPQFDRSLETMPSPAFAYDLLPESLTSSPVYATSFSRVLGQRPQLYICTQSCRGRCTFCSTYLIHGRTVARPLVLIRQDLEALIERTRCDSIEFHDDDLSQHPEFPALIDLMGELGIPWFAYLRVDGLTGNQAQHMADAGCRRVFLGLEAMNQETLDYFNKEVTVEDNRTTARAFGDAGIGVVAGYIIGAPHHTLDMIFNDVEELLALPIYAINCTILSPDPATVEFVRARKAGRYGDDVVRTNRMLRLVPDPKRYGLAEPVGLPAVCDAITKEDLNRLQAAVNCRFYYRDHVYERLCEGRTPEQRASVDDYYRHVDRQLALLAPGADDPMLTPYLERTRAQVDGFNRQHQLVP
jgi:anaerobic magnesium-protoporphyrin IX monomethyl ester cyclase